MNTADTVERLVAPVLANIGLELVDVESRPGHLKVTVDRVGGLDLEALTQATSLVSHTLDEADPVPGGRYELEVSSPGVERRLRRPEHFARLIGAEIALKLRPGVEEGAERRFEAKLLEAGEDGIAVAVTPEEGVARSPEALGSHVRTLAYDDIDRAHTLFDWRAALAAAPEPPSRQERREQRPSAADRSRAAAAARAEADPPRGERAGVPANGSTTDHDTDLTETI